MSGVKGKSGRKRVLSTIMREAMDNHREKLPEYLDALSLLALHGDREAIIYFLNQIIGKPKSIVEIEGGEKLGSGIVTQILDIIQSNTRDTYKLNVGETKVIGVSDATIKEEE